jgi:hypothetical protein
MFMKRLLLGALALLLPSLAFGQGTLPIALTQQFAFTNCASFTNACGTPLSGGLLYFYQVGTVATVQNSFQDTGLTILNPWPLPLDANGRIPPFYLANGSVHVRLTDAAGVVQFDYPNMLVIGPSSGGGGGSSVDPTTIMATGDFKWRATGEFLAGWVKANAQTVGGAGSGASQRANADTSSLFTYLWTNCPDAHCPVSGGRGVSGASDFAANKQIALPDCRGRVCGVGLDDMGNTAAGHLLASSVTSGGGDTTTTPNATGGVSNVTLTTNQLPVFTPSGTIGGSQTFNNVVTSAGGQNVASAAAPAVNIPGSITVQGSNFTFTGNPIGGGQLINTISPFMLGTWYIKL